MEPHFGWVKDGVSLWWLFVNRNKACVTLRLSPPEGAALLKELRCRAGPATAPR